MHQNNQNTQHVPVMLDEVLRYLSPREGESYLDLTAGYGGHASAVLERTKSPSRALLVDRDENAIKALKARFADDHVEVMHFDFKSASLELTDGNRRFDLILADLGVSSPHLNEVNRGFAINANGPLDMRMDQSQTLTAADVVNTYSADELSDILRQYGEEPKNRTIARLIVQNRPYKTTGDLAMVVSRAWPGHSKIHPATRTFQAIRIAVNDELGQLERSLPLWIGLLNPGGRVVVISFHSIEDRLVKQSLKEASEGLGSPLTLLTERPVTAGTQELVFNPRARSAKLRAAVKNKNISVSS